MEAPKLQPISNKLNSKDKPANASCSVQKLKDAAPSGGALREVVASSSRPYNDTERGSGEATSHNTNTNKRYNQYDKPSSYRGKNYDPNYRSKHNFNNYNSYSYYKYKSPTYDKYRYINNHRTSQSNWEPSGSHTRTYSSSKTFTEKSFPTAEEKSFNRRVDYSNNSSAKDLHSTAETAENKNNEPEISRRALNCIYQTTPIKHKNRKKELKHLHKTAKHKTPTHVKKRPHEESNRKVESGHVSADPKSVTPVNVPSHKKKDEINRTINKERGNNSTDQTSTYKDSSDLNKSPNPKSSNQESSVKDQTDSGECLLTVLTNIKGEQKSFEDFANPAPKVTVETIQNSTIDSISTEFDFFKTEPHSEDLGPFNDCAPSADCEAGFPKISLIPLSRLLRHELLDLTEYNLNAFENDESTSAQVTRQTTPPKSNYRPNLLVRRRKISTCSNSSSNTADPLVEKVASMDKVGIKNVINSSGTKYDEALKQQARKRLREEIRKQLKSVQMEQPKDAKTVDFVTDDIVDSIHIPDVIIDEIRKAFGIELLDATANTVEKAVGNAPAQSTNLSTAEGTDKQIEENVINKTSAATSQAKGTKDNDLAAERSVSAETVSSPPQKGANGVEEFSSKVAHNLMDRLKTAEHIKAVSSKFPAVTTSEPVAPRSINDKSSLVNSASSPRAGRNTLNEDITKVNVIPGKSPKKKSSHSTDRSKKSSTTKTVRKSKKKSPKRHERTRRRPAPDDIIVINSSSSSASSTSSSSSSSSSSDSESESSANSVSSSLRRRRLKQRVDAENVVDSFEKLILSSLSESLAERYSSKYSNSTFAKLHFISCICTSEYNSEKFTKTEIAKVQRNLKSEDRAMALEFLMREIVNVFNKQKKGAKRAEDTDGGRKEDEDAIKPQIRKTSNVNAHPPTEANHTTAELNSANRIRRTSQTESTRSKSVNAAEKLVTAAKIAELIEGLRKSQQQEQGQSSTMQSTPPKHQSVDEQTVTQAGVEGKSAAPAKMPPEINENAALSAQSNTNASSNANGTANCINTKPQADDDNEKDCQNEFQTEVVSGAHDEKAIVEANDSKNILISPKNPSTSTYLNCLPSTFCGLEYASSTYRSFDIGPLSGNGVGGLSSLSQFPNFPAIDLDALKQQSPIGEAVVSSLREIDFKLQEVHKRKVFIEEMLLKLQKDKMETDLLTIKLQNEKFILLNTAMTANATVAAMTANAKVKTEAATSTTTTSETEELNPSSTKETTLEKVKVFAKTKTTYRKRQAVAAPTERIKRRCVVRKIRAQKVQSTTRRSANIADRQSQSPSDTTTPNVDTVPTSECISLPNGELEGLKSAATQIRIYEDAFVAATEDGSLYKYNARNLQLEAQFPKHSEAITDMHLCQEKKMLYTTSLDGYFKKSSIENFELDIQSLYVQEPLQSIEVQWGTAFLGSRWGNVFTYDTNTNSISKETLCSTNASIIAIKATKEGPRKVLIISSKGSCVQFRDANDGLLLRTLDVPKHLNIYSLLLDYSHIYCGTQKKEIFKYDFTSGAPLSILTCGNGAVSMKLYLDKYIFAGCYDGYIYVLDKDTSNQIGRFLGSGKMVLTLEIVGNKIISSAKDKTIKIIDIPAHILSKMTQ